MGSNPLDPATNTTAYRTVIFARWFFVLSWSRSFLLIVCAVSTTSPTDRGTGYCFRSISLFVCLFLSFFLSFFASKITRKRLDRFAWNFQGRCGVTVGRPDYIFWSIRRNRAMPRCATRERGLLCFSTTACLLSGSVHKTMLAASRFLSASWIFFSPSRIDVHSVE